MPDELAAAVTERTRLVLLNTPHNPTGKVFTRDELELVASLCREHELVAVADEVYEHLVYDGAHVPLATLDGMAERTLTISSLGKTFSVTGWKIGWATGPAELVGAVRAAKQFLSFAGGTPLQHAGAAALGLGDEFYAGADGGLRGQARPAVRRPARRRARAAAAGGHVLRQRARRRRRRGVLPRAAGAGGRGGDPDLRVLRPPGGRALARALRVLQAGRGDRRGGGAARARSRDALVLPRGKRFPSERERSGAAARRHHHERGHRAGWG